MKLIARPLVVLAILVQAQLATGSPGTQYIGVDLYSIPTSDLNLLGRVSGGQVVGGRDATLWVAPAGSPRNLAPLDQPSAILTATDGVSQVGHVLTASNALHAGLWKGTADSFVDLHPTHLSHITRSEARSVTGGQQVGVGYDANFTSHALTWNGTAQSAIDLNPTGLGTVYGSEAFGTDGHQQVGYANVPSGLRAIVWEGSAASAIDLHPSHLTNDTGHEIYSMSLANGVAAGQQVGEGRLSGGGSHAMLWHGTAESALTLHPSHLSEVLSSSALATNGSVQVGWGSAEQTGLQAFLWRGTPDSALNLHALLPAGFIGSVASSIDDQGRVYGIATTATGYHAVTWVPVPEPSSSVLAVMGFAALLASFRRRTPEATQLRRC